MGDTVTEWRDNIVDNHDASSGDTAGWTVSAVTVVGGTVTAGDAKHKIGRNVKTFQDLWLSSYKPKLTVSSQTGIYYFLLEATASLEQVIYASDMTDNEPIEVRIVTDFKLVTQQNDYDSDVLARLEIEVLYSDETRDYFICPYVTGIEQENRSILNDWLRETVICALREDLSVISIILTATTTTLTGGLKVDQISLQEKNLSIVDDIDGGDDGDVLTTNEEGNAQWRRPPPVFVFTITGTLTADDDSCPALPAPYECIVDRVYAYVKTAPENISAGGDAIIIDIKKNGTTMFPDPYEPERAKIQHGEQSAESDVPYNITPYSKNLAKNDILTMVVTQVGDSVAGADLTVEVRCK